MLESLCNHAIKGKVVLPTVSVASMCLNITYPKLTSLPLKMQCSKLTFNRVTLSAWPFQGLINDAIWLAKFGIGDTGIGTELSHHKAHQRGQISPICF